MIKVASYNIRKGIGTDRRRSPERILAVLAEIDADVVALQEADRRFGARAQVIPPHLLDEQGKLVERAWYFVRDTPGVINFAGPKDRPVPMRDSEVESLLGQMAEREGGQAKPKVSFEVGETVKVADGPFQNQSGVVEEIDPARGKLRVSVTIFGRTAPVELEYWQVERG